MEHFDLKDAKEDLFIQMMRSATRSSLMSCSIKVSNLIAEVMLELFNLSPNLYCLHVSIYCYIIGCFQLTWFLFLFYCRLNQEERLNRN